MAKFSRKVKRQYSNEIIAKEQPKIFSQVWFNTWIPRTKKSMLTLVGVFAFVTVVCIPILMQFYSMNVAAILGHGIITSGTLVFVFYKLFPSKEEVSIKILVLRFVVLMILLGGITLLCGWLV